MRLAPHPGKAPGNATRPRGPGACALPHAPREHGDTPAPHPAHDTISRGDTRRLGGAHLGAAEPHRGSLIRFRKRKLSQRDHHERQHYGVVAQAAMTMAAMAPGPA